MPRCELGSFLCRRCQEVMTQTVLLEHLRVPAGQFLPVMRTACCACEKLTPLARQAQERMRTISRPLEVFRLCPGPGSGREGGSVVALAPTCTHGHKSAWWGRRLVCAGWLPHDDGSAAACRCPGSGVNVGCRLLLDSSRARTKVLPRHVRHSPGGHVLSGRAHV